MREEGEERKWYQEFGKIWLTTVGVWYIIITRLDGLVG